MAEKNNSNEINIMRLYDAPLSVVWDAWTDPKQVAQWWGPRGFLLTSHSKDLKSGGHWHYTMHGPDGKNYENKTKYLEVEKHSKLVYDHGGNDNQAPLFRVTVLFREIRGKTQMDMTMTLPTPEAANETKKFIKEAGGNATWDRLAEHLVKGSEDKDIFVINRSFEAPIDLMFDLWTKPEHFSKWLAPTGFEMKFIEANIKEGGTSFYSMSNEFYTLYGKIEYREIKRPDRIVYLQHFCDENGNMSRHPMAPTWPAKMLTTVIFTEEYPSQTRVTVSWEVYGDASPEEIATFVQSRSGMTQGWTGSFDKLDEYLNKI